MIPYGRHSINADDIDAVVDVLEHHFLTQGQMVPAFERAICDYTGSGYCTAVNSGTSGLHVACLALGIGPEDCVWTSPISFVASANCALYCGATVDFVDIDPHTRNMSITALKEKLVEAAASGSLPKAIVVVHFSGLSCDMKTIGALAAEYGVKIIEDAAHAFGGNYLAEAIGRGRYSDICVFSFHPVKSITTAEGGAVTTNDEGLAQRIELYAKHGVTRDPKLLTEVQGPWYYQQHLLGYNYRLSDLHAALGISQLTRLDEFVSKRRRLAAQYEALLQGLPIRKPLVDAERQSAWHLYMIEVQSHDRASVFATLQSKGIGANVHYIPIHLQPFYAQLGFRPGQFPNAEMFYSNAITLPLYPDMTDAQQHVVVDTLTSILQ